MEPETTEERNIRQFNEMIESVRGLTQTQINACAWVMGVDGCGWTKEYIELSLMEDLNKLPR